MRRSSIARLERLHPMLRVPEASPGSREVVDRRKPEIAEHWRTEALYEHHSTEAQKLSMDLALLYHRDVFCEGGIWAGTWVELTGSGVWKFRTTGEVPTRRFLFHGNYRSLKVAPDLARMLLRRDVGQPVPEPWATSAPPAPRVLAPNWPGFSEHDPVEFEPLDIPVMTE